MERVWRWCRRRPAVASLLAALTFTVFVAFGVLLAFYWRADEQRRRAELARQAAERNLVIASTAVGQLESLVFTALVGFNSLQADKLDGTVNLMRPLLAMPEMVRQLKHDDLVHLSHIYGHVSARLRAYGHWNEASVLALERIALLRNGQPRAQESEDYLLESADALLDAAAIEGRVAHFETARVQLDEAAALAAHGANVNSELHVSDTGLSRGYLASLLSAEYINLADRAGGSWRL